MMSHHDFRVSAVQPVLQCRTAASPATSTDDRSVCACEGRAVIGRDLRSGQSSPACCVLRLRYCAGIGPEPDWRNGVRIAGLQVNQRLRVRCLQNGITLPGRGCISPRRMCCDVDPKADPADLKAIAITATFLYPLLMGRPAWCWSHLAQHKPSVRRARCYTHGEHWHCWLFVSLTLASH
jgi:hypothetical protein